MEDDRHDRVGKLSNKFYGNFDSDEESDSFLNKQLLSKRKDKKDDIGYAALCESSPEEEESGRLLVKAKRSNPFKFSKKDKKDKGSKQKDGKEKEHKQKNAKDKDTKPMDGCADAATENIMAAATAVRSGSSTDIDCAHVCEEVAMVEQAAQDRDDKNGTMGAHHKTDMKAAKSDKKSHRFSLKKQKSIKQKLGIKETQKPANVESAVPELPVFGVPLSLAVQRSKCHDSVPLPLIVRQCIDTIQERGLECEGIYRLSGVYSHVAALRKLYDWRLSVSLTDQDPHTVACLLKLFLRELPESILTEELLPQFELAATLKDTSQLVEQLSQLLDQLPAVNKLLVQYLFKHTQHVIENEKVNKMSAQNVLLIFAPTLKVSHRLLNAFFMYGKIFFDGITIEKYEPPLTSGQLLPTTLPAIGAEIAKLDSLLAQLHSWTDSCLGDGQHEQRLWEAQIVLTKLKRKQKLLMQQRANSGSEQLLECRDKHPQAPPPQQQQQHSVAAAAPAAADHEQQQQQQRSSTDGQATGNVRESGCSRAPAPRTSTVHIINQDNVTVIEVADGGQDSVAEAMAGKETDKDGGAAAGQSGGGGGGGAAGGQTVSGSLHTQPSFSDLHHRSPPQPSTAATTVTAPTAAVRAATAAAPAAAATATTDTTCATTNINNNSSSCDSAEPKEETVAGAEMVLLPPPPPVKHSQQGEEERQQLLRQLVLLKLEELLVVADNRQLRSRLAAERIEIGRLREKILETEALRQHSCPVDGDGESSASYSCDVSNDNSSSSSSADLYSQLVTVVKHNQELEASNRQIRCSVDTELRLCRQLKAQIQFHQIVASASTG